MKACIHCQAMIENDSANFCPACGGVQNAAAAPTLMQEAAPAAPYAAPPVMPAPYAVQPPVSQLHTPGFSVLVHAFSSTAFLVLCAVNTALVATSIISAFSSANLYNSLLTGISPAVVSGMATIGALLGQILPTLLCVALWMTYVAAKKALVTGQMEPNGFKMYRACLILQTVFSCVIIGLLLLVALLMGGVASTGGALGLFGNSANEMMIVGTIAVVVLLVAGSILALSIVYTVKFCKTIRAFCHTAQTGQAVPYVSTFVQVINWIGAISMIFSAFVSLFAISSFIDIIALLSAVACVTYYFMLAIGLGKYKKAITDAANASASAYTQPMA